MGVFYCTREDVKAALDVKETQRSNAQIDRVIEGASRAIEGQMHRFFYPNSTVHKFDWPELPWSGSYPWRVWLNEWEVISVSSLVSGGVTIPSGNYLLENVNYGPPYGRIDINLGSSSSFNASTTWQQSLVVTGVFGFTNATTPGGTLTAAITTTTATSCTISDASLVGTGSVLLIDSEYMLVTGRSMSTTSQTLQVDMTASVSNVSVSVTDGTKYSVGEIILLDSERMLIVDIAGNVLTVKRAWDGSVIAVHTGSVTIYALRTLTITRGALGTTAAAHSNAAPVSVHAVPGGVRNLCVAEAINTLLTEESGYARTIGSGDNVRNATGAGLADMRAQVYGEYGRKARMRAS